MPTKCDFIVRFTLREVYFIVALIYEIGRAHV